MSNNIILGTRKSPLALAQTEIVSKKLKEAFCDINIEIKTITTYGDKNLNINYKNSNLSLKRGFQNSRFSQTEMET